MKKLVVSALFIAFAPSAFAADNHPCAKLMDACKAGGYSKGQHKGKKGLHMDCMKPLLEGQNVEGVTASADDVAACKDKKAAHKK